MFNESVITSQQLPIKQKDRKVTDCCCALFGAIFALTLFVLACVFWNKNHFLKLYYPYVHLQNICKNNQFIHFNNLRNLQIKQCFKNCPQEFQTNNIFRVCLPKQQKLRIKYIQNKQFTEPFNKIGFLQTCFYVFILSIGWGIFRMTITNFLPRYMPILSYVTGALILLGFVALTFTTKIVWSKLGIWSYVFGGFVVILALILVVMLFMYSNEVKFQGYMIEYSVKFLNSNCQTFIYIPIFIFLHFCLIALGLFQHSTFSSPQFGKYHVWKLYAGQILQIFNLIQYIWGLQFLRDAYNYCVSGLAIDWYWTSNSSCCRPIQRLICKNWGSVVGGSFLNAFLQVPTLLVELITCHPGTCCSKFGTCCYNSCNFLSFIFQLVRTDAYSYITISGIPFCDSSRQCAKLCDKSKQFVGYHSAMKHHRLAAFIASVSFIFFWSFLILRHRTLNYEIWHLIVLIFLIYGTLSWFIGINCESAQGLQTSYLTQLQIEGEHQYMQKLLPSIRKILQPHQNRIQRDGNC